MVLLKINEPWKISIFEAIILRQKQKSATKVMHVFVTVLEGPYLLYIYMYIFWKWVNAFYWKEVPIDFLEFKNSENLAFLGCFSKAKLEGQEKNN